MKIDGTEIAKKILEDLKIKVQKLSTIPHLAIILIGNDPASISYIEQKDLKAEKIGAKTTVINLESRVRNSELNEILEKLNKDNSIHGIIVQRPVPQIIDIAKLDNAIYPKKDADGFHAQSKFQPPIYLAVMEILQKVCSYTPRVKPQFIDWLKNKKIVVIGKGETGGKPIIKTFKEMGVDPIVIDSKTENPENLTKNADIIISAVGKPNIIKPDMIKKGVILISIGLHKGSNGKLHGDYEEDKIKKIASFYTPTPGGVGPVNVAMLLKNLVYAAL